MKSLVAVWLLVAVFGLCGTGVTAYSSDDQLQQVSDLLGRGEFAKVVELCSEVIRMEPTNARAYFGRSLAMLYQGKNDAAIADANRAIRLQPQAAGGYGVRGLALMNMNDMTQAMKDFNKAIELEPDFYQYYGDRGRCYYNRGSYREAVADFSRAIELKAYRGDYAMRAMAYAELGETELAKADLRALDGMQEDEWSFVMKAECYSRLGMFGAAVAEYSKALDARPDAVEILAFRASAYVKMGNPLAAATDIDRALKLGPMTSADFCNLSNACGLLGNYAKARELAERSLAVKYTLMAQFNLAQAYEGLGDRASALSAYQRLPSPDMMDSKMKKEKEKLKARLAGNWDKYKEWL